MNEQHANSVNTRKDFKECAADVIADFIGALEKSGRFVRKSYVPVNDSSHFERFNYAAGQDRVSIVYDTKARMLSITAKPEITDTLEALFFKRLAAPAAPEQQSGFIAPAPVAPRKLKISDKLQEKRKSVSAPARLTTEKDGKSPGKSADQPPMPPSTSSEAFAPEYKNGYSVKDCKRETFDAICKRVRAIKGVVTKTAAERAGKPDEHITVEITDAKRQKTYLRYLPRKKSLTLQGKRSDLYTEIQLLLNASADYNTAITSHIKSSGEEQRTSAVERRLKKLIPSAFDYLSDQSKIDLSIGLIDIYNDKTRLSDYSVLLVPPYRGLERLIYDLQTAQDIRVKMIGQAYEKREDGSYCLKSGYRKKINSVIYNEVLSALYAEYFRERHSFTHSDNTNPLSARVIREIGEARTKFDNLLNVIDYNCKKLKEIGFSVVKK